jgi:hypothetical protein
VERFSTFASNRQAFGIAIKGQRLQAIEYVFPVDGSTKVSGGFWHLV